MRHLGTLLIVTQFVVAAHLSHLDRKQQRSRRRFVARYQAAPAESIGRQALHATTEVVAFPERLVLSVTNHLMQHALRSRTEVDRNLIEPPYQCFVA
jgi:hypothetical protein